MIDVDVLVIGAGPAGLSAASYSSRAGYNTLVIDNMGPGGQLMFIDTIENYPGVKSISGYELSEKFESQCKEFGVRIEYLKAEKIEKTSSGFIFKTDSDDIKAKAMVMATGAAHRHLGVPGEDEYRGKGVSYCATCDGPFFKGKDIIVVGGGDTALTDALYLSKLASKVTIVHRRDEFRAQKILQDRVKADTKIALEMNNNIKSINGDGEKVVSVTLLDGRKIKTDAVFVLVGTVPNSELVNSLCKLDQSGYIITDRGMATTLEGLFAAGDVRDTTFRQVVTASSDGAVAAHSLDHYLESRK